MKTKGKEEYFFTGSGTMPIKGKGLVYGDKIPDGAVPVGALVDLINKGIVSTERPDLTSGSAADRIPVHVLQSKVSVLEKENVKLADANDKLTEQLRVESDKLRGQLRERDIRIAELEHALESAGQDITAGLGAESGPSLADDGAGPAADDGAGPAAGGKGGKK